MRSAATSIPAWKGQAFDLYPSGSKPMREGLGRMARVRSALETMPSADRQEVLAMLDELTRPMTAREVDQALLASGLSRADRKRMVNALKGLSILMVAY